MAVSVFRMWGFRVGIMAQWVPQKLSMMLPILRLFLWVLAALLPFQSTDNVPGCSRWWLKHFSSCHRCEKCALNFWLQGIEGIWKVKPFCLFLCTLSNKQMGLFKNCCTERGTNTLLPFYSLVHSIDGASDPWLTISVPGAMSFILVCKWVQEAKHSCHLGLLSQVYYRELDKQWSSWNSNPYPQGCWHHKAWLCVHNGLIVLYMLKIFFITF